MTASESLQNFPEELRRLPRWIHWRKQFRDRKPTKVPYQAGNGRLASSTDPTTWCTLEEAVNSTRKKDGIGFVLGDGIIGIDLDHVIDPKTQAITKAAGWVTTTINSYTEVSPSGEGLHALAYAEIPQGAGHKRDWFECYSDGRYFTVTGNHLAGTPMTIENRQEEFRQVHEKIFSRAWSQLSRGNGNGAGIGAMDPGSTPTMDSVIDRARKYLAKIPGAISGQGGHNQTFAAACAMVLGFDLDENTSYGLLSEYNQRCEPPWSEKELLHKIHSANEQPGQRGYLRDKESPEFETPPDPADDEALLERAAIQDESKPEAEPAFVPEPYWKQYDVSEIHDWKCPELVPVIDRILAKGNLCWLAAETQTGKTLFMLWVCLKLLNKGMLFDKFAITPINRILYVACEDPARRFKARLQDMMTTAIEAGRFVVYVAPGLSIADPNCFQFLEDMIREGDFDLVVIDTFQAATMGLSSFDDEKLSVVIRHLLGITRKLGTTIVVNDHFRKTQNSKKRTELDFNDVKGTGGKLQNADVFLLMDRRDGQLRISGRSKEWDSGIGLLVNIAPQGSHDAEKFTYAGDLQDMVNTQKQKGSANREAVFEAIGNEWTTREEIGNKLSMSKSTSAKHITALFDEGKIEKRGSGKVIYYRRASDRDENTLWTEN